MSLKNLEMSGPSITKKEIKFVLDVMKNGWYGKKKYFYVEKFEKEFAKYHGRKYGLMTTNCTQALHLILHSLGIKKGHNVINQECTWAASAAAVSYTGAKNIFADISEDNWCMSYESLVKTVNKRTKAVIATGIYGNMAEMDKIEKYCKKKKIFLIEDAAESFGSVYKGKKSGKFGIASAFSFHRTKTITTGEGGMIVTDNKSLYEKCKFYRDQGRDVNSTYNILELGFKYMPFNLQASLGYSQFLRKNQILKKKRWICAVYKKEFKNYKVQLNLQNKYLVNGCWATTMVIDKSYGLNAKQIIKKLLRLNVVARPFFSPLSNMKPFYCKKSKKKNFIAYDLYKRGITLPSPLNANLKDLKKYAEIVKNILNKSTIKNSN